ncbi:MAG: class F sortase [Thermomicrobiales bacterium]|nr:class F sortase [Thermomicrobiales bacterium]MCO5223222.1 class F sortase [Thermomicrobiales bacterium]
MAVTSSFASVRLPLAPQVVAAAPSLLAQGGVAPRELGEQPTTGGARPGPVNAVPGLRSPGVLPVAMRIETIELDASIEQQQIVDGVMQNPSGPFVVAWYKETGRLGEASNNVVLAGHLDYWDVGPAIFYDVWKLEEGDRVEVTGKNGAVFVYRVDWVQAYKMEELDSATIQEIIGPTPTENLTLITCGGTFDYATGEYEERVIVRATRITG